MLGSFAKRYVLYAVAAAVVLLLVLAAIFVLVKPAGGSIIAYESENMSPVSGPQFSVGENYTYELVVPGSTLNATLGVAGEDSVNGSRCLRVVRTFEGSVNGVAPPRFAACYSAVNGSMEYFEAFNGTGWMRMQAGTYDSNPVMMFYEPWMLSLRDGWSGSFNVTGTLRPGAVEVVKFVQKDVSFYRFLRRENVSGRPALVAEAVSFDVSISGGKETFSNMLKRTVWVDEERRVMLKEIDEGGGETAEKVLVGAPFSLYRP